MFFCEAEFLVRYLRVFHAFSWRYIMVRTRYVTAVLAVAIAMALVGSLAYVVTAQAVPPIVMKPSMRIYVYSDGTFSVNYVLNLVIKQSKPSPKPTSGSLDLIIKYRESSDTITLTVRGGGAFTSGKASGVASQKFVIESSGGLEGSSVASKKVLNVNALGGLTVINATPKEVKRNSLTIKKLVVNANPYVADIAFNAVVTGTNLSTKLPVGTDISELVNSKLASSGLSFIKFKKLVITKEGNSLVINGYAEVSIKDLISSGVKMGVLSSSDVDKLKWCLENSFKDLKIGGKYELLIAGYKYANEASGAKFKVAADFMIHGDIKGYKNVSRACSRELSKLGMVISALSSQAASVASGGTAKFKVSMPPPSFMEKFTPSKSPKITPVYPYEGTVKLHISLSSTEFSMLLNVTTGKLKWVGSGSPKELVKEGLAELRDYLSEFSKKLSFLELMGIKSPIPSTIEVYYVGSGGKVVAKGETSLSDLPYAGAELVAKGAAVTTTPPAPPTKVPTKTVTLPITVTKTVTVSKEVTSVITKTVTKELTTTKTLTSTVTTTTTKYVEKPVVSTTNLVLIGAFAVVIAAIVAGLARRR